MNCSRVQFNQHKAFINEGFTLLELIVSMAVMTVIMLAIGSAMLVATHAMPQADAPANELIEAGQVAEQIATELQYAISINSYTANTVEFTVADRDGNDVPETIRYEWSGTAGDPLTRQYNGSAAVEVLPAIQQFSLTYNIETISEEVTTENESGEMLLKSRTGTENLADYAIKDGQWYGQYFFPSLPADTISWKVTRIEFYAKTHGAYNGVCQVQLQLPTIANLPSGVVLEEKTLLESTLLDTYVKQQFNYSNVSGLSPDKGLCIVFKWISDADACDIRGRNEGAGYIYNHGVKSTTNGASWTSLGDESLLYYAHGTATTAGEPQVQETYFLKAVDIELRTGSDQQSNILTSANILNKPEVIQ